MELGIRFSFGVQVFSSRKIDPVRADISGEGVADCVKGLDSGKNDRFIRDFWEVFGLDDFIPHAKGGAEAWIHPKARYTLNWFKQGKEIERLDSSRPQNLRFMNRKGLTWTYVKRTGRRFGYLPRTGTFDSTGPMLFPRIKNSEWKFLAILNSDLFHALFLSLTLERHWQISDVGRIPWPEIVQQITEVEKLAERQFEITLNERVYDITSPYYIGPVLLPESWANGWFHPGQAFMEEIPDGCSVGFSTGSSNESLRNLALRSEGKSY